MMVGFRMAAMAAAVAIGGAGCKQQAEKPEASRPPLNPAPNAAAPIAQGDQSGPLTLVMAKRITCIERAGGSSPALEACDSDAIDAMDGLLTRSTNNKSFDSLLSDLFEPLLFLRTGGEDILSDRMVVSDALADLARRRVSILSGVPDSTPSSPGRTGGPFDALAGQKVDLALLEQKWRAIRSADCAAYQVNNCAERLDAALRYVIEGITV